MKYGRGGGTLHSLAVLYESPALFSSDSIPHIPIADIQEERIVLQFKDVDSY